VIVRSFFASPSTFAGRDVTANAGSVT